MEVRPNCSAEELQAITKDFQKTVEFLEESVSAIETAALQFATNAKSKKSKPQITGSPSVYSNLALLPPPQIPKNLLVVFQELKEPQTLMQEIENLNRNCKNFEPKIDPLFELNQHLRNRYFVSDYENSLYEFNSFWRVWKSIITLHRTGAETPVPGGEPHSNGERKAIEASFSEDVSPQNLPEISWARWKSLKEELRPRKLFTQQFVNERIDERLKTGDDIPIMIDCFVRAYVEECGHLHVGKIMSLDEGENIKIRIKEKVTGQIIACRPWDVSVLPSPEEGLPSQATMLKNLDKRALSASVLVLRQKHYVCKAMENIKESFFKDGNWESETAANDFNYLAQRLKIIDKHLPNIMLKFHVSASKNVDANDLKNHYVTIISRLKETLRKHKESKTDERFKTVFDSLIASLQAKQEQKIRADVQFELLNAMNMKQEELEQYLHSEGKEEAFDLISTIVMFLRQLGSEGDLNLQQNDCYKVLMDRLNDTISKEAYFEFADLVVLLLSKIDPSRK